MNPDAMMELLCSLDPKYPTAVCDLMAVLHVRRTEAVYDLMRYAIIKGYRLGQCTAIVGGRLVGAIEIVGGAGGHARVKAAAEAYWAKTQGSNDAPASKDFA